MKQLQQTILGGGPDGFGNCYPTCIAMILNVDPDTVPHVYQIHPDDDDAADDHIREWLSDKHQCGIHRIVYDCSFCSYQDVLDMSLKNSIGVPLIMSGLGYHDNNHAVVIQNGKVFCDPYVGKPKTKPFKGGCEFDNMDGRYWIIEAIVRLF